MGMHMTIKLVTTQGAVNALLTSVVVYFPLFIVLILDAAAARASLLWIVFLLKHSRWLATKSCPCNANSRSSVRYTVTGELERLCSTLRVGVYEYDLTMPIRSLSAMISTDLVYASLCSSTPYTKLPSVPLLMN
ncbi:hypothetical protein PF005_g1665 [Phytophthora fragariae]|uniref:Uncharacterized protein n=1 Tax=Phytophthora fragariae TaxID=53985 RepID=A0A6A4AGW4_9STRA|nr:hypothetical protein PF007_g13594 [Phytophthora fragariae]KAE9234995.1 hypothetical protein PF005_g1665 [Phytophthora fragariae]KAE9253702.1 hypothetical protein PF004_g1378 [Phytophthora fragariae]KAE9256143.1 hypothetical protein PF002_g2013 [Phytophthora fragariae]